MPLVVMLLLVTLLAPAPVLQTVTLSGCMEQDAASRVTAFKLVVKKPNGTEIYRLTSPPTINLAAELGHVVEATGNVSKVNRAGREELELAVSALKRVAEKCE